MYLTKRDSCNFILHSMLPEIAAKGMSIKVDSLGCIWPVEADDPDLRVFVESMRRRLTEMLSRPSLPPSPYGI